MATKKGAEKEVNKAISAEDYFADFDFSEVEADMATLMKNGVHFGHKKSRRHPKMDEYIYTTKQQINIINLQKTLEQLEKALKFIRKTKKEGKGVLLVGTKKQAKKLVKSAAIKCEQPYVVERWLGGTFTNFKVMKKRVDYLKNSEAKMEKGEYNHYTKFERTKKAEEIEKLEKKIGGLKNMEQLPGVIFIIDAKEDRLAIKEAQKMNIPVVALSDTNIDPTSIDYPIPANDDAISSIRLMLAYVCKAIIE